MSAHKSIWLMGLLMPTGGQLLVDDQPVAGSRVRAWQRSIAHVPQSIYLADTTLAENIEKYEQNFGVIDEPQAGFPPMNFGTPNTMA